VARRLDTATHQAVDALAKPFVDIEAEQRGPQTANSAAAAWEDPFESLSMSDTKDDTSSGVACQGS